MSEYKCYLVESFQCAMSQLECYDIYSVAGVNPTQNLVESFHGSRLLTSRCFLLRWTDCLGDAGKVQTS